MEGSERSHPHRSGSSAGGASDFFICFTARPSSSAATSSASAAMRVPSSKALMSPGRGRDPSSAPALSASLSRRLRSSGSVKGGQSPMFPSGVPLAGRKKGCAYEAAEPSSPKVTCIGQVRVKAKKKVKSKAKKALARSRSQRGRREAERECCPGRNQSWVHQVPLSICETLRGIGSDFSCFLPCGGRSLCGGGGSSRTGEEKGGDERRIGRSASSSSCGAVLARWVVAVQESEEEVKGREKVEVGFLLTEREEKVAEVEIEELGNRGGEKGEILVMGGEEEAARVSVCIPPRNALLLMRCRSDPVRMAALASRFWGSPVNKQQSEEDRVNEEENEVEVVVQKQARTADIEEEEHEDPSTEKEESDAVEDSVITAVELVEEENDCEKTTEVETALMEENLQLLDEEIDSARENRSRGSPPMLQINSSREEQEKDELRNRSEHLPEKEEEEKAEEDKIKGSRVKEERRYGNVCASRSKERGKRRCKEKDGRRHSFSSEIDSRRHSFSSEREARRASFSIDRGTRWSFSLGKTDLESKDVRTLPFSAAEVCPEEEKKREVTPEEEGAKSRGDKGTEKLANGEVKHEPEVEDEKKGAAGEWTELPDCLLMMMYEPKLSMEVSKETWVSGNDFLRWRPHNTRNRIPSKPDIAVQASGDNEAAPPLESASIVACAPEDTAPVAVTAPPAEQPRASVVQHKLSARPAAVAPYEPLVLTRCKSEPVRSSARLTPDACFWKDRHRPIGAAGIGF